MKLLLACLALAAFVCTQANSFQTPVHFTTLHKLAKVGGLKNGNRLIRPKISGGQEASPGEFPYQAGFTVDDYYFCGATIIHESYVLTAASCAYDGQTFTVYVGSITLGRDASPKQSLVSNEAIIHENYDPNGFSYDIAMIRLPYSLTFDENIGKISLPPFFDVTNNNGLIMGWGSTYTGGDLSPTLLYAYVTIIKNEDCKAIYGDLITDSHICTMPQDNEGLCNGDFGGPLISVYRVGECEIEKALVGISSFISSGGCGVGPDGYTRVYKFIDWIYYHME